MDSPLYKSQSNWGASCTGYGFPTLQVTKQLGRFLNRVWIPQFTNHKAAGELPV